MGALVIFINLLKCLWFRTITWFSRSRRTLPTQRSATPFCQGLRYAVRTGSHPIAFIVATTSALNFASGSKITLLMLDFPKARLGSLGFGGCGSCAKCALASTFWLPLDPVPHNVLPGVEESRSAGKADGRSLRWLDYVPCA